MGKRKERLSEGKKNIIADLIREYGINPFKLGKIYLKTRNIMDL